jgi:hypothetical protein
MPTLEFWKARALEAERGEVEAEAARQENPKFFSGRGSILATPESMGSAGEGAPNPYPEAPQVTYEYSGEVIVINGRKYTPEGLPIDD